MYNLSSCTNSQKCWGKFSDVSFKQKSNNNLLNYVSLNTKSWHQVNADIKGSPCLSNNTKTLHQMPTRKRGLWSNKPSIKK